VLLVVLVEYLRALAVVTIMAAGKGSSSKPHSGHCIDPPINLPQVQALETRIRTELITLGLFEPEEDTKVGGATWSHDTEVGGPKIT
jgi:hypothetical protein